MPRPTALGGYGAVAGPERTERPRPPSRSRWLALVAAPLAVVVVCAATLRPRAVAPLLAHIVAYYGDTARAVGGGDGTGAGVTLVSEDRWLDCCANLCITGRAVARAPTRLDAGR